MDLKFDIRGNLYPSRKTEIDFSTFEEIFVNSFEPTSSRYVILENYKNYLTDFREKMTPDFIQLVNGSFVSTKENPGDIDFVTIVKHEVCQEKKLIVQEFFSKSAAKKKYNIDAYLVEMYEENDKQYFLSKSDLAYWNNFFGSTKPNRRRKKFPKGYLQITFGNPDY